MKLVGGDSGRCEREEIVEEAILAPSERVILDVLSSAPASWRSSTTRPRRSTGSRRSR